MRIQSVEPSRTAVMVIDMQNDFIQPGAPIFSQMGYDMVESLAEFLDKCREAGMLVIYTKHVLRSDGLDRGPFDELCPPVKEGAALIDGTPGGEIYDGLAPKDKDIVLKKQRYSAFYDTSLDNILSTCKIDTLVITGVNTEVCCFSTARDAVNRNYKIAFLSDLTGTLDSEDRGYGSMKAEEMHRATLINLALTTADVMDSKQFLELVNR